MHCTTAAPLRRLFVEQTKLRRLRNWNGHKMCKTEAFGWIKMCCLLEKCSMEGLLHDSRTKNDIYFILQSVKIRLIYMFNVITATSTSTSTSQQMRTIWFAFKFVLSLFFLMCWILSHEVNPITDRRNILSFWVHIVIVSIANTYKLQQTEYVYVAYFVK